MSLVSTSFAQSTDPAWMDELRVQLIVEKQCEVRFFINFREKQKALGIEYEVRVQCEDGRFFDASRAATDTQFKIEACDRVICEAPNKANKG